MFFVIAVCFLYGAYPSTLLWIHSLFFAIYNIIITESSHCVVAWNFLFKHETVLLHFCMPFLSTLLRVFINCSCSLSNQLLMMGTIVSSLRPYTFAWNTFSTSISKFNSFTYLSGAFKFNTGWLSIDPTYIGLCCSSGMWFGWQACLPHYSYCHCSCLNCCLHLFRILFRFCLLSNFCLLRSASIFLGKSFNPDTMWCH